jgi:hypothetical protein
MTLIAITALCAPHSAREPRLTWGRVAASSPFHNVRPHPLRERGLTFLLYNPAATLIAKLKVCGRENQSQAQDQDHVMVQTTAKSVGLKKSPWLTMPANNERSTSAGGDDSEKQRLNQAQVTAIANSEPSSGAGKDAF